MRMCLTPKECDEFIRLCLEDGFAKSKGEMRRLLEQGSVSLICIDDVRLDESVPVVPPWIWKKEIGRASCRERV